MITEWSWFLSIFPFGLFLFLLFFRKLTLPVISILVLIMTLIIQVTFWEILPVYLLTSATKGFFVAFDILLIVFGAVFFLEILKDIGIIENIGFYLESISKDYRIQVILLAWFFINFMEGMAGFGTPGAIVAPILVSLGLSPLTAVIMSLLGNSSAGVFGAAGTPIRIGFAGLDVTNVPWFAVLFNSVGLLIPVFMVWMLVKNQEKRWTHFFEVLPFALWSGFLFVFSSIVVVGLGQEFVSIIGSMLAIVMIIISLKLGMFVPKQERSLIKRIKIKMSIPLRKVVLPYLVIFILLVLGKSILKTIDIHFPWGYTHTFNFFNPGFIFVISGVPFALVWGRKKLLHGCIRNAITRTLDPFLVILSMSTMIQLMVNSGNNISGLPSVLSVLTKNINGTLLPFVVPFVGAFGSFLTGSITISNILFGNIFAQASAIYNLSVAKVLALEVSGAAIGNSMAIADIMAAEAVVGMKNKTRSVLRGVVGPCLVCLSILGVVGFLILR
ncbi:MAG TPA: L-lactate permease [Spirochaetia bacterium]|nr:L-lactate permease [Spirochaetia bacterium]